MGDGVVRNPVEELPALRVPHKRTLMIFRFWPFPDLNLAIVALCIVAGHEPARCF